MGFEPEAAVLNVITFIIYIIRSQTNPLMKGQCPSDTNMDTYDVIEWRRHPTPGDK